MKNICDICGYEHRTIVYEQPDGILRCKLCRQRVEYGHTFFTDDDEYEAMKKGKRMPIKPIAENEIYE